MPSKLADRMKVKTMAKATPATLAARAPLAAAADAGLAGAMTADIESSVMALSQPLSTSLERDLRRRPELE